MHQLTNKKGLKRITSISYIDRLLTFHNVEYIHQYLIFGLPVMPNQIHSFESFHLVQKDESNELVFLDDLIIFQLNYIKIQT